MQNLLELLGEEAPRSRLNDVPAVLVRAQALLLLVFVPLTAQWDCCSIKITVQPELSRPREQMWVHRSGKGRCGVVLTTLESPTSHTEVFRCGG